MDFIDDLGITDLRRMASQMKIPGYSKRKQPWRLRNDIKSKIDDPVWLNSLSVSKEQLTEAFRELKEKVELKKEIERERSVSPGVKSARVSRVKDSIQSSIAKVAKCQLELKALKDRNGVCSVDIVEKRVIDMISQYNKEHPNTDIKVVLEELKSNLAEKEKENKSLKESLSKDQIDAVATLKTCQVLTQELNTNQKKLQEELSKAKTQLETKDEIPELQAKEIERLTQEVSTYIERIEELTQELEEQKYNIQIQTENLTGDKAIETHFDQELRLLNVKLTSCVQDLEHNREKVDMLTKRLDTCDTQRDDITTKFNNCSATLEQNSKDLDQCNIKCVTKDIIIKQLRLHKEEIETAVNKQLAKSKEYADMAEEEQKRFSEYFRVSMLGAVLFAIADVISKNI